MQYSMHMHECASFHCAWDLHGTQHIKLSFCNGAYSSIALQGGLRACSQNLWRLNGGNCHAGQQRCQLCNKSVEQLQNQGHCSLQL